MMSKRTGVMMTLTLLIFHTSVLLPKYTLPFSSMNVSKSPSFSFCLSRTFFGMVTWNLYVMVLTPRISLSFLVSFDIPTNQANKEKLINMPKELTGGKAGKEALRCQ